MAIQQVVIEIPRAGLAGEDRPAQLWPGVLNDLKLRFATAKMVRATEINYVECKDAFEAE